jgi:hypothetical protein
MIPKTLILAMLAAGLFAQEPQTRQAPAPDPKDQKIAWLEKRIQALEAKIQALSQFYNAEMELTRLEREKPVPLKETTK